MTFDHSQRAAEKSFLNFDVEELANPAFQLSDELVDALLDKLSSDEEFRSVFQRSPRIALAYLGHEAAANAKASDEGVWWCLQCDCLADAATIKASRDELRKQLLSSKTQYDPIKLQA